MIGDIRSLVVEPTLIVAASLHQQNCNIRYPDEQLHQKNKSVAVDTGDVASPEPPPIQSVMVSEPPSEHKVNHKSTRCGLVLYPAIVPVLAREYRAPGEPYRSLVGVVCTRNGGIGGRHHGGRPRPGIDLGAGLCARPDCFGDRLRSLNQLLGAEEDTQSEGRIF